MGHDVHILVPESWPNVPGDDEPSDSVPFSIHRHSSALHGYDGVYFLQGLSESIERIDPDGVITHGEPWQFITGQTGWICNRLGVSHAVFSWENLDRVPSSRVKRGLESLVYSRIDGIIAGSEATETRLRNRGFDGPITTAPQTGVDTEKFSPDVDGTDVRSSFGIGADSPLVLYAGRLVAEKGINVLVDAVPAVSKAVPEAEFLILGTGPMEDELRSQIDKTVDTDRVTLVTERQPYSRMPKIYNSADIFTYPSVTIDDWAEQFGYATVEAMSCGVPVVTTECGALPSVVGDGGLVCPEHDAGSLADRLSDLLTDPEYRREIGNAARERASTKFSLSGVAKTQVEFISQLSSSRSGGVR
ncbi:glycosyl transferases group 1 family protein [Halorubrum sp. AJ67]|nr:glycosyl transferases group 1 family protein [Halorubrum sp. AJ67]